MNPRLTLLCPLALSCLGASVSKPDFYYSIGPSVEGGVNVIEVAFDPLKYPNAYFHARVMEDRTLSVPFDPDEAVQDQNGYLHFHARFELRHWVEGETLTYAFGLLKRSYVLGIDLSEYYVYVEARKKVGEGYGYFDFDENVVQEAQREAEVYDPRIDPRQSHVYHDAYAVRGIKRNILLAKRGVGLSDLVIEYVNPYADSYKYPRAELRLLDHREDFEDVAFDSGGYSVLPLKVTQMHVLGEGTTYRFSLESPLYYSQIDAKASNERIPGEPCFRSDDLFLPLRQGHDEATWHYHIVLFGAGAYEDEVLVRQSAYSSRKFFGPCDSAEYCLVGGGPKR